MNSTGRTAALWLFLSFLLLHFLQSYYLPPCASSSTALLLPSITRMEWLPLDPLQHYSSVSFTYSYSQAQPLLPHVVSHLLQLLQHTHIYEWPHRLINHQMIQNSNPSSRWLSRHRKRLVKLYWGMRAVQTLPRVKPIVGICWRWLILFVRRLVLLLWLDTTWIFVLQVWSTPNSLYCKHHHLNHAH